MIAGISLGVGLALSTQPTNFTQAASYYQISTQNAVSYVVQFKQSARNDGLFATGPCIILVPRRKSQMPRLRA